jgi:peptidoglycan-associated lipoprotein
MTYKERIKMNASTAWVAVLFCCAIANAQKPAALDRIELAFSYSAAFAGQPAGTPSFWLNGGNAEVASKIYRDCGLALNITGLHTGSTGAGVPLNLLIATIGPRYTWTLKKPSKGRPSVSLFAEGLVGAAHGFNSLFPGQPAAVTSATSFAAQLGGGVDVAISPRLRLRALDASWLNTQLPNGARNIQNDIQLGAGVIFQLSKKNHLQ